MNVIIIEDEVQSAWDIQHCIKKLRPDFAVNTILDSVETSVEWLLTHEHPDLIISDIRLGDGLSFEIFKRIALECPVIFCTAYDEYAIQAFRSNGIAYVLKPVSESALEESLRKIESLARTFSRSVDTALIDSLRLAIEAKSKYRSTLLVSYRNEMIPVRVEDIAFFAIEEDCTILRTARGKKYRISETLEHIESSVDPKNFFRANRQYLVAHGAITKIEHFHARKLLLELSLPYMEPVIVSKAKATEFLLWMENR
ncbi:MAG TPA: LytTR family DNA-binding domain-containing protein [Chryseolinea sp.]|nr:LytTR family DNA-binding domain-containing protein [Chryseolinea sp.]